LNKLFEHKGDKTIWVVFLILSLISIVLVYSASNYLAVNQYGGSNMRFLFKQVAIVIFGYFSMQWISKINYRHFQWMSKLLLIAVLIILTLTALSGTNINNASRWLSIPIINISFQSSDFAKIVLLTFLAGSLSKLEQKYKNPPLDRYHIYLMVFLPAILVSVLILPSNLSTALLIFTASFFMMWIGNVKLKYLSSLVGAVLILIVVVFFVAKSNPNLLPRFDTWVSRIENFGSNNSDANYQVVQAKIAIASNPLIGKLPGKSSQRAFLPSAHADFIFAIVIEEYGTIIGFFLVILYLILFYRAIIIAKKSETKFGALLSLGLMFSIVFQAFVNIGVAVNLLPVTGQTLPLISMGGTSFVFTSVALGMVQSVSNGLKKAKIVMEEIV
jgi:cell division protein FtsW